MLGQSVGTKVNYGRNISSGQAIQGRGWGTMLGLSVCTKRHEILGPLGAEGPEGEKYVRFIGTEAKGIGGGPAGVGGPG